MLLSSSFASPPTAITLTNEKIWYECKPRFETEMLSIKVKNESDLSVKE